jgi:hypothetical protein
VFGVDWETEVEVGILQIGMFFWESATKRIFEIDHFLCVLKRFFFFFQSAFISGESIPCQTATKATTPDKLWQKQR